MATRNPASIKDTEKTRNIEIDVVEVIGLDEMEVALEAVAVAFGLHISRITRLGTKRYPGNRHWHLKQDAGTTGCLDVTYWPLGPLLWVSIRGYEPAWVHDDGPELAGALWSHLQGGAAR